ncbi:MAG: helix-turn-helix domain-containing protein [Cyanobacteriota bacterium]
METVLNPGLLTLPLLGRPWLCKSSQDAQEWAESVSIIAPVRICEPLIGTLPFQSDTALLSLGDVVVISTRGSAITVSTDHHPFSRLMIPYGCWGVFRVEGRRYENPVGDSVFYMPPLPFQMENDITCGVALNLNPDSLVQTALTMAGPDGVLPSRMGVFQEPRLLRLHQPAFAHVINGIYALLLSIHQLTSLPGVNFTLYRFDDVILRMVVLLLLPELQGGESPASVEAAPSAAARAKLEELVEWIEDNLGESIGLSDLELRVHWSRRTLQYAFRDVYGCSPMQWVRRRRLHRAMQRLTRPQPGDTVTLIGREFGFPSPVAFSHDFRRVYGCTPSSVFRQ